MTNEDAEEKARYLVQQYNDAHDQQTKLTIIKALGKNRTDVAFRKLKKIFENTDNHERKNAAILAIGSNWKAQNTTTSTTTNKKPKQSYDDFDKVPDFLKWG